LRSIEHSLRWPARTRFLSWSKVVLIGVLLRPFRADFGGEVVRVLPMSDLLRCREVDVLSDVHPDPFVIRPRLTKRLDYMGFV
jgi:predicted membrane GTPase involved in stress response